MRKVVLFLFIILITGLLCAETQVDGDVTSNQTWTLAGSPYIVSGTRYIYNNATVTIEAGVQVRFNAGAGLVLGSYSQGNIQAESISSNPIVFTANTDDPVPGFWNSISSSVWTGNSRFENCVFEYGGSSTGCFYVNGGSPYFKNSIFRYSPNYGLFSETWQSNSMQVNSCVFSNNSKPLSISVADMAGLKLGNQYQSNTDNRIHCPGGTPQNSSVWSYQPVPIYFTADFNVGNGSGRTTTIPNGSILEFSSGTQVYISTGDKLNATGVTFRGAQATAGFWKGFNFYYNAGNSLLSGCTIRDAGYSDHPALRFENPASIVTGCTITNCQGVGIWMTYNCLQSISANTISACGSYPLSLFDESVRVLGEGNNFSGNTLDMVEIRSWSIQTSGVWRNPGVPYLLTGSLIINGSSPFPHLKIMPGTVVKLLHQVQIAVGSPYSFAQGSLEAEGVTFTRATPTAVPYGLVFDSWVVSSQCVFTDCVFEYLQGSNQSAALSRGNGATFINCVFRNNPASALSCESPGKFTVLGCSFENNGSYPIRIYATNFDALNGLGCTYTGNNPDRVLVYAGTLSEAKTYVWNNPGIPVEISGALQVSGSWPTPPMLKLNSGLVILVNGNWFWIGSVYGFAPGGIQADGVTFSSLSGATGGWNGLYLDYSVTSDSYLRNCIVENASQANIVIVYATMPVIESCIIRNGIRGIWLQQNSGTPSIIRNHIMNNTVGVQCDGGTSPIIGGSLADANSIIGNTSLGVQNTSSSVTVNATYNWWGHASGPYHSVSNPGGQGNAVSNWVNYDPWRDADIGDAPSRFNLMTPVSGSVLQTLTPLLDWEDSIDPTPGDVVTYVVELALNSGFTQGLFSSPVLSASFWPVPAATLSDDTRYYWRVKATDTQNQTTINYGNYFYFDTAVPEAPLPFDLIGPDYNSTVSLTSNLLSWEAAIDPDWGDSVTYTVYWDISAGFENPGSVGSGTTSAYSGFCAPGSLIYWKVKATDQTGLFTFSPTWRFFVDWDARPRPPVELTLTPAGNDLLVSWDAVPGADSYDVYQATLPYGDQVLLQSGVVAPQYLHLGAGLATRGFYTVVSHDTQ